MSGVRVIAYIANGFTVVVPLSNSSVVATATLAPALSLRWLSLGNRLSTVAVCIGIGNMLSSSLNWMYTTFCIRLNV